MTLLVSSHLERQGKLYQCNICGAYWEDSNGTYPVGLSKEEVREHYGV